MLLPQQRVETPKLNSIHTQVTESMYASCFKKKSESKKAQKMNAMIQLAKLIARHCSSRNTCLSKAQLWRSLRHQRITSMQKYVERVMVTFRKMPVYLHLNWSSWEKLKKDRFKEHRQEEASCQSSHKRFADCWSTSGSAWDTQTAPRAAHHKLFQY